MSAAAQGLVRLPVWRARFVLAVLHSNLHLERMADLCVTISKLTKLAYGLPPDETLIEGFDEMASRAEEMIRVLTHESPLPPLVGRSVPRSG